MSREQRFLSGIAFSTCGVVHVAGIHIVGLFTPLFRKVNKPMTQISAMRTTCKIMLKTMPEWNLFWQGRNIFTINSFQWHFLVWVKATWLAQLFIHFIYFFNWLFLFQAITGLNGMQLGEKKLIVQRASVGAKTNMNNVSKSLCEAGLEKITLLKQFGFFQIIILITRIQTHLK